MNHQVHFAIQVKNDPFPPPPDFRHPLTAQKMLPFFLPWFAQTMAADRQRLQTPADKSRAQLTNNGLNFRQFGHNSTLLAMNEHRLGPTPGADYRRNGPSLTPRLPFA